MPPRIPWSRDELLVAFRLYCRTPFGKLHQHNPEIIELSRLLGRTPSAVGMKACNFASLDPVQHARNIAALGNVSRADRDLWTAFEENAEAVAAEAAYAALYPRPGTPGRGQGEGSQLSTRGAPPLEAELDLPEGPTETERTVRIRRVQAFFRAAVLASYEYRCALSDIAVPELLNASHIIPWSENPARRADPRNGIALNVLYDRAFDRGLITFEASLRVVISHRLKVRAPCPFQRQVLLSLEGRELRRPYRFEPDGAALLHHREHVFA